jgi:hypothetical protein
MAEYAVGDKVVLKDDGQLYIVVGVRIEDRIVLFDLEKGHLEVKKAYRPQQPQVVVYKATDVSIKS